MCRSTKFSDKSNPLEKGHELALSQLKTHPTMARKSRQRSLKLVALTQLKGREQMCADCSVPFLHLYYSRSPARENDPLALKMDPPTVSNKIVPHRCAQKPISLVTADPVRMTV